MSVTATKSIRELNAEARSKLTEAKVIFDKEEEASLEELQHAKTLTEEAEAIEAELVRAARPEAIKTANRIANTIGSLTGPVDRPSLGGAPANGDGIGTGRDGRIHSTEIKTAGELFIEDDAIKAWLAVVAPNGRAPDRLSHPSPSVEVKTLYTLAGDITASRPMLGLQDRRPDIVPLGWNPLVLRALVTNSTTSSDLVEVVRELSRTNNAAPVAEATSASGSSGTKPESALAFEVIQVAVKTIAHWIPATTRILADASRLRSEIDAFLRMGIDQSLENEMLNGDGTGEHFTGILNTSGLLTQAWSTDILTTTRKARTKIKVSGFTMPTAYVLSPADWETIDLTQDAEQRYYFGGPMVLGTPRLWGVPVVESLYEPDGRGLLGNFTDAVLYDRQQTAVNVGTINDDFIRNLVRILAEMRAAFHVRRPKSFVDIDLTA